MTELRTERLTLRHFRADDEDDVAAAFDVYRWPEVTRWLGGDSKPWPDLDAARQKLARWATYSEEHPGYGIWGVIPRDVGRPVGTVLLSPLQLSEGGPDEAIEVGWDLNPDYWGHGYATEAAAALLEHAFSTLGLEIVHAVAYPENSRSLAVMLRLGMTRQGRTDRWYELTLDWWTVDREGFEGRGSEMP